jgi:hypothetical protein
MTALRVQRILDVQMEERTICADAGPLLILKVGGLDEVQSQDKAAVFG